VPLTKLKEEKKPTVVVRGVEVVVVVGVQMIVAEVMVVVEE